MSDSPLLEISELTKSYSGVTVLDHVSFSTYSGLVLGLIGENGAGKSTLIKCIGGVISPDSGSIRFEGRDYQPSIPNALKNGIITIPQEFNLAGTLSVRENIFLGRELKKCGFLDHAAMRRTAAELMEKLHCPLPPDQPVSELSIAQKQLVEIARALNCECRLLIMDEPTTVLNPPEAENLFRIMRSMRDQGIGLIYVSHKLREVKQVCDQVLILRDGQFVSRTMISKITVKEMANRMVGRELSTIFPLKIYPPADAPAVLQVSSLSQAGRLHDISFFLRKGEIMGFAGLGGAGRTELAETLYGIRRKSTGTIRIDGREIDPASPVDAVRAGIAYLSEDRQNAGTIQSFGLTENITLISLRKYCRGSFIRKEAETGAAAGYRERFRIKAASLHAPIRELSGGNQQKGAIAKSLDAQPRIFIFDEPTRGIDIQSRGEIYQFIHQLAEEGMACLVISSDLEEIIGLCSQVAVMREGSIAGFLEDPHITENEIMYHAAGVK
ncbi:MAG: sugar ABC transporter ATP-binding protein [Lentisphaeria bacterium]|nr:sugar ABC transporter ATP-binding protein [Lentisphaeria bacterium]